MTIRVTTPPPPTSPSKPHTLQTLREIPKSRYASQLAFTVLPYARSRKLLLSHVEVYKNVETVATALRTSGVRPGTVCAMICPVSLEAVIYFLALMWIGAIAAPIDPTLRWKHMKEYLKEMNAFCVVSPFVENDNDDNGGKKDGLWDKVDKAANHLGILNWGLKRSINEGVTVEMYGTRADKSAAWSGGAGDFKIDPAEIAVRLATSNVDSHDDDDENSDEDGESNACSPKILAFTHANLASAATLFSETYHLASEVTTIMSAALHTTEGILIVISTLFSGGHLLIPGPISLDTDTFLEIAKAHKVKWLSCKPAFAEALAGALDNTDTNGAQLEFIRCCGKTPKDMTVYETIRDRLGVPVLNAYSSDASAGLVTANRPDLYRHGTLGKAVSQSDVKIFDPETREVLEAGGEGEIGVAGPTVSEGYTNDDALNQHSIVRLEDTDSYFLTGDLGVLDEDGYLKVYGTAKEMRARKLAEQEEEESRQRGLAALALQREEDERVEQEARELEEQRLAEERETAEKEVAEREAEERAREQREAEEREAAEREARDQEERELAEKDAEENARREAEESAATALANTRNIEPGNVSDRDVALLKETAGNKYLDPETARLILERLAAIEANQKLFQEEVERRHQQELADLQARLDEAQRRLEEKEAMSAALREAVESANRSNKSAQDAAEAAREAAEAIANQQKGDEAPSVVEITDPNCVTRTVKVSLDDIEDAMKMHPSVAEAKAFGRPDPRYGWEVYCAVRPKVGARVSEAWLKLHAQSVLAAAFVPRKFFLKEDLLRETDRLELSKDESMNPIIATKARGKAKLVKPPSWKPMNSSYASSNIST